jgi:acyl dehydratase
MEVDTRWAMAYAAGIGDNLPCYMDTRRAGGIVAHPVFPVCFEWPSWLSIRERTHASLSQAEAVRAVHAVQHMIFHRPVRPPERLATTATVIGVERRKPGAYIVVKFETLDEIGDLVCTTYAGSIYLRVEITGTDHSGAMPKPPTPAVLPASPRVEIKMPIAAGAAHVFSECARIWHPIHTDAAVAESAGLPAPILYGPATLALVVSRVIEAEAGNDPERVAEVYGRFGAMVLMPSEMMLRIRAREKGDGGDAVFFEAISAEGGRAIRDGVVILRS